MKDYQPSEDPASKLCPLYAISAAMSGASGDAAFEKCRGNTCALFSKYHYCCGLRLHQGEK